MRKFLITSTLFLATIAGGFSQTATTDPVGFVSGTALGNSDTHFSMSLHRSPSYQGAVSSVSSNVITMSGTPAWTTNQFVYSGTAQSNTYYIQLTSGTKAGMYYTVTANSANTLTLDLAGDTIAGAVLNGDTLKVIPYWTLATLFPSQTGITTTTSIAGSGTGLTRIFTPDMASAGIDLSAAKQYYYYSGGSFGGPGWRQQGGGFSSIRDNDILLPDAYLMVRQDGVSASNITFTGSVPTSAIAFVIGTVSSGVEQDNALGFGVPSNTTLAQSALYSGTSGAFAGTTSISGIGGDKLYVFDPAQSGYDKSAGQTYYYYTGASFGGPGWRLAGGGFSNIQDNTVVFIPGASVIIRKVAAVTPSTVTWKTTPNYLPL